MESNNKRWRKVTPSNKIKELPCPREKFSMDVYDYSLFIYGGIGNKGAVLKDFYQFEITTQQWKKLKSKNGPGARHSHATAVDKHYLIVHGGRDRKDNILDDLWFYNFSTNEWNFVQNTNLPRYGHVLNCIPNYNTLRLIGANNLEQGVVYEWDLSDDSAKFELRFPSYQKSPRSYFGAVTTEQCTLMYGGNSDMVLLYSQYDRSHFANDRSTVKIVPVTRVNGSTAEYIDNHYMLIGGIYEDKNPATTQFFNKEHNKFIALNEHELGELPQISYHKSVQTLNSIFVFGGVKSNGQLSNELYQYSEDQSLINVQLPNEIVVEICKHLPAYQLLKIARTSRSYYKLICEEGQLFQNEIMTAKVRSLKYIYQRDGLNVKLLQSSSDEARRRVGQALAQMELTDEIDPTLESFTGPVPTCFGVVNVNGHIVEENGPSLAALCLCDVSDPKALSNLQREISWSQHIIFIAVVAYNSKQADQRVIDVSKLKELAAKYPDAVVFEASSITLSEVLPAFTLLAERLLRLLVRQKMDTIKAVRFL